MHSRGAWPEGPRVPKVVDVDEQRARIIEAAWSVILENGFEAATMRGIASRAGCTTGFVTHYFTSKEDLLLKMVRHISQRARARIELALEGRRGMDAVRALLIETTPIGRDHAEEWRIWVALWDHAMTIPRLSAEWNRRSEGWRGLLRDALNDAMLDHELSRAAPIEQLVDSLSAVHHGLSLAAALSPGRSTASRTVAILDQQLSFIATAYPGTTPRRRLA